jgi:hypothetical protein
MSVSPVTEVESTSKAPGKKALTGDDSAYIIMTLHASALLKGRRIMRILMDRQIDEMLCWLKVVNRGGIINLCR